MTYSDFSMYFTTYTENIAMNKAIITNVTTAEMAEHLVQQV